MQSRYIQDFHTSAGEGAYKKEFELPLNEATDSSKNAHLICCVSFLDGTAIVKVLFFCKSITASIKAQDLFKILDTFMVENNVKWKSILVSVLMVVV